MFKPKFDLKIKIDRNEWIEGAFERGGSFCAMGFAANSMKVQHRLYDSVGGYIREALNSIPDRLSNKEKLALKKKIQAEIKAMKPIENHIVEINDAPLERNDDNKWYIDATVPKKLIPKALHCVFKARKKTAKLSDCFGPYKSHDDAVKGKEELIEALFNKAGFQVEFSGRRSNADVG